MSTAFIQPGHVITAAAPYDRTSGQAALLGANLIGIAQTTVLSGAVAEWMVTGVHRVTKVGTQAWAVGAAVYWDNSAKAFTTTAAVGNYRAGTIMVATGAGAGETVGVVRLTGEVTFPVSATYVAR